METISARKIEEETRAHSEGAVNGAVLDEEDSCASNATYRHGEHTINDNDAKLNVIMCNTFAKTCDNVQIVQCALHRRHRRFRSRHGVSLKAFSNYGLHLIINQ